MKYIKLILIAAFLSTMFTGCSYVSDMAEGALTDRASFTVKAVYSGGNVTISWDKTDSSIDDFAGIEVYRTSERNNENANYELVASRYYNNSSLNNGLTTSFTDTTLTTYYDSTPASGGIYFYRVAFFHWDQPLAKRDAAHGYSDFPLWNTAANLETNYNSHTDIDASSGYAKVVIP